MRVRITIGGKDVLRFTAAPLRLATRGSPFDALQVPALSSTPTAVPGAVGYHVGVWAKYRSGVSHLIEFDADAALASPPAVGPAAR
jgi:hypothetical protein